MKLTIKSNGKLNKIKTTKNENREIEGITIDFEGSNLWSDSELWLRDNNGDYLDHMALNVSKRNKLQSHK